MMALEPALFPRPVAFLPQRMALSATVHQAAPCWTHQAAPCLSCPPDALSRFTLKNTDMLYRGKEGSMLVAHGQREEQTEGGRPGKGFPSLFIRLSLRSFGLQGRNPT